MLTAINQIETGFVRYIPASEVALNKHHTKIIHIHFKKKVYQNDVLGELDRG